MVHDAEIDALIDWGLYGIAVIGAAVFCVTTWLESRKKQGRKS